MAEKRLILCPYCGNTQNEPEDRCAACGGYFDSLSLKVTQEHMGPWFVRDRYNPFRPGMSYDVLKREIEKSRIKPTTIIKGPTTRQFWSVARNVPGVAHLVGYCHACGAHVKGNDDNCSECGEVFFAPKLRDNLGLAPMGTEVQARSKLSDSGAYTAVTTAKPGEPATPSPDNASTPGAAAAAAAGLTLPGMGTPSTPATPAPPPPTTDQPVGSSILAGLRTDGADRDAAAVGAATSHANASRDAMAWLTPGANQEPDTLQTAGDATAALPKQSSPMTWILIGINVLLFIVAAVAIIVVIGRGGGDKPTPPPGPSDNSTPPPATSGMDAIDTTTTPGDTGDSDVELADPLDGSFGDADEPDTTPEPAPVDNTAEQRQQWADAFDQALSQEQDGQLDDALAAMKKIVAEAPQNVQPAGLDAAIKRVEKKISKAELDAIFN